MYRSNIQISDVSKPDSLGRSSFFVDWTDPYDGKRHGQRFFAVPADTLQQARQNMADRLRFDRRYRRDADVKGG